MARINLDKGLHISAWVVMLAYFLPYIVLGEDISITIHDNLDSNLVWLKLVFENTTLFSPIDTTIPQIMGGMPLSSLAPVYDLQFFIFKTFGIFNGYVIIRFAMLLIGFYGMRALLRNHVTTEMRSSSEVEMIIYGVSLCFTILPHWGYNLSIATLPLVFNALLNIQNRQSTKWDYAVVVFVGCTSSLILVGIFTLAGFGLYGLLQWYTKRICPLKLYGGLLIISAISILTYWRIFAGVLNPSGLPSHRTEFDLLYNWMGTIFSRANGILIDGWYHAASIHYLMLLLVPMALVLAWKKTTNYKLINAIEFIVLSCLWYSIVNWSGALPITSIITNIVPIQLGRLHFIQPLVWYVLFALSLFYLAKHTRWGKMALPFLIVAQVVILFFNHEGFTQRNQPSYKAFYATALFDQVREHLGPEESKERSIFISSHPAILQYNGFYTLDGYLADYPLEYKHAFGEIIQGELDKNPKLNKGFKNWGSRAYAVVAQLGKNFIHPKLPPLEGARAVPASGVGRINTSSPRGEGWDEGAPQASIEGLDYNWQAFTDLGGKYIFSPLPIDDPNLKHLKTFDHEDAAWTIYLYVLAEEGIKYEVANTK